jgi:cytochrome c-type biogenesis protein CcsB
MAYVIFITILFYMLSASAYFAYLFLQKDFLQKAGYILMAIGFLLHSVSIGYTFIKVGRMPAQNLYETLSLTGWAVAGVFLAFQYKFNLKILGIYAAPLATLILIISSLLPRGAVQINDLFKSYWLVIHILMVFLGEASFALACGLGILYLIQERAIKTKTHGFFFKRLPSLERIDTMGYACIVVGFTLLSIGLITGFVYAKMVWGRFWSWDPKEVWSGITWLLYAALLHERLAIGWRGRRSAITAIIGFAVILFTFLGVNFLLKGHHWEFTRF